MSKLDDYRRKVTEFVDKRNEVGKAKQHPRGKLSAMERIEALLDPKTFQEINMFVKHRSTSALMQGKEIPGEGVITGWGKVHGRQVFVYSQDFTAMGGSLGEMQAYKICNIMDMARKARAPIIGINDSGGARINEGIDALRGYGEIFQRNVDLSGVVPQISIILGPCAGGAVYSPAITDFIFMCKSHGGMFITGPAVIKKVTGEDVDQQTLGGGSVHASRSGVAHFLCESENDTFSQVRELIGYLPQNNDGRTQRGKQNIWKWRKNHSSIIPDNPRQPYDMKEVITNVADKHEFLEVHKLYSGNMIVGFMRIDGHSVGVVANQPRVFAGCLDIDASDKASRFIRFCDAFNIPIVTFVDTPGYLPGLQQEHSGIIRHGAKLLYAYSEATVPKITIIVRKAYGGAYIAMGSRHLGADLVLAWPTAEIAVMGPEGAVEIIHSREIKGSENPQSVIQKRIGEYRDEFANPYVAASRGYVDAVIDPDQTHEVLHEAFEALSNKEASRLKRKHGNIPL